VYCSPTSRTRRKETRCYLLHAQTNTTLGQSTGDYTVFIYGLNVAAYAHNIVVSIQLSNGSTLAASAHNHSYTCILHSRSANSHRWAKVNEATKYTPHPPMISITNSLHTVLHLPNYHLLSYHYCSPPSGVT